jgi:uroporphyrinogen decarboxylase
MSKRDRLEATFTGQPVDRPAVALWRHWPVDDQRGDELARAALVFQHTYDFDFIKVTPSGNYCVTGYGAETTWEGNQEGTRRYSSRVIQSPEDWRRLKPLDPDEGLLREVIHANEVIGQSVREEVPFIQTIFNPLSQAKNLAGDRLLSDLRQHPDEVKAGLATITDGMWFNLVHLHGVNVMFDLVSAYPAQVINWHDVETPPSLSEARDRTNMALCGGLRQWETMVRGTPQAVEIEARAAVQAAGGQGFILGTGCVTPITAPTGNILAARKAVEAPA